MNIATEWHGFMPYQTWSGTLRDRNSTAIDLRNRSSCGIFSLHHAMVFLGVGAEFKSLRNGHPSFLDKIYFGTNSEQLVSLGRAHGLQTVAYESWTVAPIRKAVDRALAAGHSVIIGSEPQVHWVCLGGRTQDGGYVWADSASDPAIGGNWSWEEIEEWMTYHEKKCVYPELQFPFEIISLAPGPKMPASRTMVPWIDGIWPNLAADSDYANDWSNLLADMLDVFWDAEYAPKGRSAGNFLDEHLDAIVDAATHQTAYSSAVLREAGLGYRDVADFHNLVVPDGQEAGVIAGFSIKLVAKANSL